MTKPSISCFGQRLHNEESSKLLQEIELKWVVAEALSSWDILLKSVWGCSESHLLDSHSMVFLGLLLHRIKKRIDRLAQRSQIRKRSGVITRLKICSMRRRQLVQFGKQGLFGRFL